MKTTDFSQTESGNECFVVLHSHPLEKDHEHFERGSRVFAGRIHKHWPRECLVQVQTDAAANYHHKWQYMSFRWEDGAAIIDARHARLLIATTMAEQADLEARTRVAAYEFPEELPIETSARHLSTSETPHAADAAPKHFGLFSPPSDFE